MICELARMRSAVVVRSLNKVVVLQTNGRPRTIKSETTRLPNALPMANMEEMIWSVLTGNSLCVV